jgi:hypothetical protein
MAKPMSIQRIDETATEVPSVYRGYPRNDAGLSSSVSWVICGAMVIVPKRS